MESKPERLEIEDVPAGVWCWLIHHEILLERSTEPMCERVEFVRKNKSPEEVETRLKWMRPVQGELPVEVIETGKAHDETWKAYDEARKAQNEAGKAYDEAIENNRLEIEKLHREECPGCPWDSEQGTLFPVPKTTEES